MRTTRRSGDELLDVARVLLLLQGSILVATTIEAFIWSLAFAGAAGAPFVLSAAAAIATFSARARLRRDRRWTRRVVYVVEGIVLTTGVIDAVLGAAIIHVLPPAVALFSQLVLPLAVVLLLREAARTTPTNATAMSPEAAS